MPATIQAVAPIQPLLTNVAIGYRNRMFVGDQLLPVVPVSSERFTYFLFGRHHFKRYNSKRNVGSAFMRVDYDARTTTGQAEEYGLEHPIDDRIRDEAQAPMDPDIQGTTLLTEALMLDQEKRIASLLTTAGNYKTSLTTTPGTKWDAASNTTIRANIKTGMEAVRQQIGRYPNVIMIPAAVAAAIAVGSELTQILQYTYGMGQITSDAEGGYYLPKVLYGMSVVIAGAIENTANLGQAETMADVWSDNVVMLYRSPSPAIWQPSTGYIFRRRMFQVQTYREEPIKSDIVRASFIQTEKLTALDTGSLLTSAYLLTDVLT